MHAPKTPENTLTQVIHLSLDTDGIATILMDRLGGSMNTIDGTFMQEFSDAIDRVTTDPAIRGAILTSGKPAFLAGADLKDMVVNLGRISKLPHQEIFDMVLPLTLMFRRMETCGKPVACAINGVALGGGTEIALACHYRVLADEPAIVMGLPEVQIGLLPAAGGTQRVPRLIGLQQGLTMLIEGNPISPARALEMGLVDCLKPKDQVLAEAKRWLLEVGTHQQPWDQPGFRLPPVGADQTHAQRCADAVTRAQSAPEYPAPLAIARAVQDGLHLELDAALRVEIEHMVGLMQSPVSRNIIRTQFISKGRANRLHKRPKDIPKAVLRHVGVLGNSALAASLAARCAQIGMAVWRPGAAAPDTLDLLLTVDGALLTDSTALPTHATLAYVSSSHDPTPAVLPPPLPAGAVELVFAGAPEKSALVEVVHSGTTSTQTLACALDFARSLRQTPILVQDLPARFVRRLNAVGSRSATPEQSAIVAQVLEAVACLQAGVVEDAADADLGAVLGAGFPAYLGGPFSLLDTQGIRSFVQDCERLQSAAAEPMQYLHRLADQEHRFYNEEGLPNPLPV